MFIQQHTVQLHYNVPLQLNMFSYLYNAYAIWSLKKTTILLVNHVDKSLAGCIRILLSNTVFFEQTFRQRWLTLFRAASWAVHTIW
jgi:hypothetical protein